MKTAATTLIAIILLAPAGSSDAQRPGDVTAAQPRAATDPISDASAGDLRRRPLGEVDILDYGPIDGAHDATTVGAALRAAQELLDSGRTARVLFPPGRVVVSGSPSLRVPLSGSLMIEGRGTELYVVDAGNGLTISGTPSGGERVQNAYSVVRDVAFTKADGQVGGVGLQINGITLSGNDLYATDENITCQDAPTATDGWLACLGLNNVTGSHKGIRANFPQNGQALRGHGTLIAISSTGTMASVDNHFSDISLLGGFAAFSMKGHVEGVYVTDFSAVATNYGVYWPYSAHADPADKGLLLTMSNGHLNTTLRGVYANHVNSIMLSHTLYYSIFAGVPQQTDSISPRDNTAWFGTAPSWAAIDIQNAGNWTVEGGQIYGGNTPGATAAYAGIVADNGGCGRSCSAGQEQPSTITGVHFTALSRCAVYLAAGLENTSVTGNSSQVTAGLCSNGNAVSQGGNSWEGSTSRNDGDHRYFDRATVAADAPTGTEGSVKFLADNLPICWNRAGSEEENYCLRHVTSAAKLFYSVNGTNVMSISDTGDLTVSGRIATGRP